MTPANVSLLNALVLIVVGLAGYVTSETPSKTAFIPVVFGGILLILNPGVRKKNKTVAHVAVLATLLILLGLIMPLKGAIGRGDGAAIARVSLMLLTTLVAMVVFVRSFIQARREKTSADPPPNAD
ncbi:hypothetical protein FYK55_18880 [Roseiconus nitratireducens]|uniref:Uncharacterized protein n=1 Tax=Roseiconus nitratireducens TaxID=2605748 RepID=A0A5M6D317_9BACT|nr:hypothetical protein [Roseiconus nitratireducens]KAA5540970.1 hypothetical protein FYK55_18880 [Roseiconus nitratireducens]